MSEPETARPRALVVDDNQADLTLLAHALESLGCAVTATRSAEEAAGVLARQEVDVILLDWNMPQMTGIEFLRKLTSHPRWRSTPVIMVTARQGSDSLSESFSGGARDYIRKPVDRMELGARINAVIREKAIFDKLSAANSELTHLCQMKDDYLSMVSHDVRAPLNSIVGFAEFLLEGKMGDLNEKQTRMIEVIKKSARAQLSLVENLLEVARLNSGRVTLHLRRADLAGIARECWEGIKPNAEKKEIEFTFNGDDGAATVMVDDMRIAQVVNNLISNAIKFTPRGGRVEVAVYRDDSGGALVVRDNGPGIPEEEMGRLFNRFEQTRVKSTAGESGFGLGLSIVKSIVEMHNGKVWVESRAGEGAHFHIRLPLALPAPAEAAR